MQLGIPDYISVVGEAVDLTLCRERLANGHYKMIKRGKAACAASMKTR